MFVLFGLSLLLYGLFYLAPADPAILTCGKGCTPERLAEVRHAMGVDDPVPTQYAHFLAGMVAGRDYPAGPATRHCPAPCLGCSCARSVLSLTRASRISRCVSARHPTRSATLPLRQR